MIYIFCLLYAAIFIIVELLQSKIKKNINWSRKATHIGSGIISYFLPLYLSSIEIIILASFFTIVLTISKQKKILRLHSVNRFTIGEILFPIAIGINAFYAVPTDIKAFQFGILVLTFSDSIAEIIGKIYPIYRFYIFKQEKSIGGSCAFLVSTLIISLVMFSTTSTIHISIAVILLTIIEMLLIFGFDNLLLPIIATFLFIVIG